MNDNFCVCCGAKIPEGRIVCPSCWAHPSREKRARRAKRSILRMFAARLMYRFSPGDKAFRAAARAIRKAKCEDIVMGGSGCGKAILAAIEPHSPDGTCVCCGAKIPEGRWVCPICAGKFGGNMK